MESNSLISSSAVSSSTSRRSAELLTEDLTSTGAVVHQLQSTKSSPPLERQFSTALCQPLNTLMFTHASTQISIYHNGSKCQTRFALLFGGWGLRIPWNATKAPPEPVQPSLQKFACTWFVMIDSKYMGLRLTRARKSTLQNMFWSISILIHTCIVMIEHISVRKHTYTYMFNRYCGYGLIVYVYVLYIQ